MATNQIVNIIFKGTDKLSPQIKSVEKKMKRMDKLAGGKGGKKRAKQASIMSGTLKSILLSGAIFNAINAMSRGIRAASANFLELDDAITAAGAKFPEKIRHGTIAFDDLRKAARKVGATTEHTAAEAGKGLEFMAMAGFNAEESVGSLKTLADLASAANFDFARAADIASDAVGAFGLQGASSAEKIAGLKRASEVLAQTSMDSNTTLETLFDTMKDAGPVMTDAGASVELFGVLAGKLGSAGIKGTKAGTTLKNAFIRLVAPPKEAAKALKKYNIETTKAGKVRDFLDIMEDMQGALRGMTEEQQIQFRNAVFGKRAIAGMGILLRQNIGEMRKLREEYKGLDGSLASLADNARKSIKKRLMVMVSTLLDKTLEVIDAFANKFPGGIEKMTAAIRSFDASGLIENLKTIFSIISKTASFLWEYREGILIFVSALKTMSIAAAVLNTSLRTLIGAVITLNIAMLANPITWIILLVGALVAAIVWMALNWDTVSKKIGEVFTNIKDWTIEMVMVTLRVLGKFADAVGGVFNSIYDGVRSGWNATIQFFKNGLMWMLKLVAKVPKVKEWLGGDEGIAAIEKNFVASDTGLMDKRAIDYSTVVSGYTDKLIRGIAASHQGEKKGSGNLPFDPVVEPKAQQSSLDQTLDIRILPTSEMPAGFTQMPVRVEAEHTDGRGRKKTYKQRSGEN